MSSVRTARPTTRPTHSFAHLIKANGNTALSGFLFFGGGHPTDPLVAGKHSDIRPDAFYSRVGLNRFVNIRGQTVQRFNL
jgi:hypothetical protein